MTDADDRLKALFATGEPPRHDPRFVLETMHRVHQRRLWWELAAAVPWLIATSAILWAAAPWLESLGRPAAYLLGGLVAPVSLVLAVLFLASPRATTL